jgi:repressor LexA
MARHWLGCGNPRRKTTFGEQEGTMVDKSILTAKQRAIYDFIKDKIMVRGYGPTVREIGAGFKIKSPNGVMCHLKALEKKGLITRESGMSRAIQLTEPLNRMALPLHGRIAAGSPIQAIEQQDHVDFGPLFEGEGQFCLRVAGNSMIDAQIADGDYVVVRKQRTARDGEIVVALLNGEEATLKRFFKEPNRVRLEPANSTMQPIYSAHVDILGVVSGVIRKY